MPGPRDPVGDPRPEPRVDLPEDRPGHEEPAPLQTGLRGRGRRGGLGRRLLGLVGGLRRLGPGPAPGDVAAGQGPGVVGVPVGDGELLRLERDRDHADRAIDPGPAEGAGGELAGGQDQVGPRADPGPVLPGVVAEVPVGDVGKLPEREDHVGQRGRQVDVLRRVQGEVDRLVALGLGPARRERQAALGLVQEPPGPEPLQDRRERLQHEVVRVGRRAERVADPPGAPRRADQEGIGPRRDAPARGGVASGGRDHHGLLRSVGATTSPFDRPRRGFGRDHNPAARIGQSQTTGITPGADWPGLAATIEWDPRPGRFGRIAPRSRRRGSLVGRAFPPTLRDSSGRRECPPHRSPVSPSSFLLGAI